MHPEVFNTGSVASRLEGSPHVVSDTEHAVIQVRQVLFVQPQKLASQSFGDRNIARPQGLGVHPQDRDRIREQVDVLPLELNDLPESHGRIESADQQTPEGQPRCGQQPGFLFPAEGSGPGNLISHRNQPLTIVKRGTGKPAHRNRFTQHPSQQGHFPVDTGNLSLAPLLFLLGLGGRFQPLRFVVFQIVIGDSLETPIGKEGIKRIQIVECALIGPHSRHLAAVNIAGFYQIAFAKQIGQVLKSSIAGRAHGNFVEFRQKGFPGSVSGVGFVPAGAPDCVSVSVRSGVRCPTVQTDLCTDLALDDRKGSFAHSIYSLLVTLKDGLGPQGVTERPNKQQNGREKVFYFRSGQRDGRTASGLWIKRSWVQIPVAAHQFPSRLHSQLHNEILKRLYSRRCA